MKVNVAGFPAFSLEASSVKAKSLDFRGRHDGTLLILRQGRSLSQNAGVHELLRSRDV